MEDFFQNENISGKDTGKILVNVIIKVRNYEDSFKEKKRTKSEGKTSDFRLGLTFSTTKEKEQKEKSVERFLPCSKL